MPKLHYLLILLMFMLVTGCDQSHHSDYDDSFISEGPYHVHLTWQGVSDPLSRSLPDVKTRMTVSFRSHSATGKVQYGMTSSYGLEKIVTGEAYSDSYLHHIELTGLNPGTVYHYRCGNESDGWSRDYTFTTAPNGPGYVRFAVLGDSRSNNTARRWVKDQVKAKNPSFVLFGGDAVEDGRSQSQWDTWFTTYQDLSAKAPTMPCVGNHEFNSGNFYSQFALPIHQPSENLVNGFKTPDEAYYSFDYSNIHIVCLTTEPVENDLTNKPQETWLRNDLQVAAANPAIRWIIVYAHRPPYSSGNHGSDLNVRNTWAPIFDLYHVDIAFFGHDHDYERTRSLKNDAIVADGQGTLYIVTGGAGAPLYSVGTNLWTVRSESIYHFCLLEVNGSSLTLNVYDDFGTRIDLFTLTK